MSKYIDAEKLIAEIKRYENTAIDAYNPHGEDADYWDGKVVACEDLKTLVTSLQQEQDMGEVSDGYHTFNELYYYRMLYNAAFFNLLPKGWVHKSKRHHTGEECFGVLAPGGFLIFKWNDTDIKVSEILKLTP